MSIKDRFLSPGSARPNLTPEEKLASIAMPTDDTAANVVRSEQITTFTRVAVIVAIIAIGVFATVKLFDNPTIPVPPDSRRYDRLKAFAVRCAYSYLSYNPTFTGTKTRAGDCTNLDSSLGVTGDKWAYIPQSVTVNAVESDSQGTYWVTVSAFLTRVNVDQSVAVHPTQSVGWRTFTFPIRGDLTAGTFQVVDFPRAETPVVDKPGSELLPSRGTACNGDECAKAETRAKQFLAKYTQGSQDDLDVFLSRGLQQRVHPLSLTGKVTPTCTVTAPSGTEEKLPSVYYADCKVAVVDDGDTSWMYSWRLDLVPEGGDYRVSSIL